VAAIQSHPPRAVIPRGAVVERETQQRRRLTWAQVITQDRVLSAIVALAVIVSIVAIVYYGSRGETLAYADGRARLNIARRVFDNLQPGFVQLGTYWLPVHMLLMVPLVYFEPLWHTGAAGIAISAVAYVLTTAYLYCTVREATGSRFGAAVAGLIALTNANFIYLQATPMSECLFLFCFTAGFYYLLRWAKERRLAQMVAAGFLLDMSALVRYDGWFAVVIGAIAVTLIAWRRADRGASARGTVTAFLVMGFYGVALFVLYNLVYFGNALEFAFGYGSASAHYDRLSVGVPYPTRGNLIHSIVTYSWASIDNVGAVLIVLACVGVGYALWRFKVKPVGIALYGFTAGYLFNVISLFLGQSILYNKHVLPTYNFLNTRYGIMALPAVAVFVGLLAAVRQPAIRVAVLAIVLAQAFQLLSTGQPISLRDPMESNINNPDNKAARDFLKSHYDSGLVLIDFKSSDGDSFYMNIPMNHFLHQGVKGTATPFLKAAGDLPRQPGTPSQYVRWVYGRADSNLIEGLGVSPDFAQNFTCVFASKLNYVYELNGPGVAPSPSCNSTGQ